jgi:hypothetical protein
MKTSSIALAILLGACCSQQPAAPTPTPAATPAAAPVAEAAPAAEASTRPSRGIIIPAAPPTFRSKTILHELVNGRPENVINDFNPTLKEALPAAKLAAVWSDLTARLGTYQSMGEPTQTEEDGRKVVFVPLTFEKGNVRARLVYDNTNYVAALTFEP